VLAVKSVKQNILPPADLLQLLETFRRMVNESLRIGLAYDVYSLKRLSLLSYKQLKKYDCPSYYKLCAISRAAGILASKKKSVRRGHSTRNPYAIKPQLVSCYGFKIEKDSLRIPLGGRRYHRIPLNKHTLSVISQPGVNLRSFTLTPRSLSLTIAREVQDIYCKTTVGVDRNLRNLTVGNEERAVQYDLSETVRIANTTMRIISSFKRDDVRIRRRIASKYGRRRKARIDNLLHSATKRIVNDAANHLEAIVLEDIRRIRRLYQHGNGQGRKYRGRMNAWSFAEAQRQIEYKARWNGLRVIRLSKRETRGTSIACPRCGERLQSDKHLKRKLWCGKCRYVMDRDMVAVVNLSKRGRLRFDRSQPTAQAQGGAVEAVMGNPTTMVIPGVDAPKLTHPTIS
jgi:putative transposase